MITIGLIAGFMLGYMAQQAVPAASVDAAIKYQVVEEGINAEQYIQEVQQIVANFRTDGYADLAHADLLSLRVPAEYTGDHLALALALGALDSRVIGAQEQLDSLILTISWLEM